MDYIDPLPEITTNELDYNILLNLYKKIRFPRNKIKNLLDEGKLLRVKKGLYVKAGSAYSAPMLANLIYGPSYLSQEYALSLLGLIPERVVMLTSMTTGRKKLFETPIGTFRYEPLPKEAYAVGIRRVEVSPTQAYLIATPEKALADLVFREKNLTTSDDVLAFLENDRRVNLDAPCSLTRLHTIARAFDSTSVFALEQMLKRRRKGE